MDIQVCTYEERFLPAYQALNREWIERYFKIEPMDLEQLENPRGLILGRGGEILVAVKDGEALGVCAMVPHGPDAFELAKMAVSVKARKLGIGDRLMSAAIAWARKRGAREITLLSNTVLEPAIALYRKHGFATVKLGTHPDYERCNIEMRLDLAELPKH